MNKKTLIICAVFAMILSCKNYAIKDLEQNAKGKIKGFIDKALDPAKDKITSSSSKVDELARKLQEEDKIKGVEENNKDELMQGDDPNSGVINSSPVLPENSQDNTPILKAAEQSGGQQEEKVKKVEESEAKVEGKEEKQENTEERNKQELAKQEEEQQKRKAEQEREEQRKRKAEKEREEQRKEAEKRQVDNEIRTLTGKIDEINRNIDVIKEQTSVGAQGVIDRITGPVYDDFTDGNKAIYKTWGDLEDDNDEGLGKLLKELSDTRHNLRTKLNEGNKAYIIDTRSTEPQLKDNVSVSEIKSDLDELKSKLEEVKEYLEDKDNFEEIKEYVAGSEDNYDEED
ncbi:ErpC protein [Borreliella carolinensis]|uniref:ErpC protein n=1 Tax=Borreliella carolinensis TaxID=478174 RepID=A0ACD5GLD4_9SPIR